MEEQKFKIEKLNDKNYSSWAYRCKLALEQRGAWRTITENKPEATAANANAITAWNKIDGTAKYIIASTIENSQLHLIKRAESAAEAWKNLKDHHHVPTLGSQVRLLTRLFTERIAPQGNMKDHINEMMSIMDELAEMDAPVEPKYAIGAIIASVNRHYSNLITGIEAWDDERLTLQALNGKLVEEWRKRESATSRKSTEDRHNTAKLEATRRSAEPQRKLEHWQPRPGTPSHSKGGSSTPQRSAQDDMTSQDGHLCHRCGKPGHFRSDCPLNQQHRQTDLRQKLNVKRTQTGNKSEMEEDDDEWYINSVFFTRAHISSTTSKDTWIIDSGASTHMCGSEELFTTLCKQDRGMITVARGIGNIKLTLGTGEKHKNVELKDVLWVPQLDGNLVSVGMLGNKGHVVMFTAHECFVTTKGTTTRVGKRINGMYMLENTPKRGKHSARQTEEEEEKEKHTRKVEPTCCIHEWHRKLAHRNLRDIRQQLKSDGTQIKKCDHSDECEDCFKGKMSRKPFKQAEPVNEPLDVIVSDVCGPFPTETINKKRYFVTFIDAHSKYTETFLMREKSEVTQVAMDYLEKLHTKHGKWPKIFRSDRGKEYLNERFQRYLLRRGIKSEFTVGYAPEQNGIAERKNRTLVEATRSMLSSSGLGKALWGEAILTATFVLNRIINKTTKETPYKTMHGKKHKYVKFHEFGSKCYAMVPDEKRRKLDNKAIEAKFLGYDYNSKGYRLLVGNRKVIVSREVNFFKKKKETEATQNEDETFDFEELDSDSEETQEVEKESTDEAQEQTDEAQEHTDDLETTRDSEYLDAEQNSSGGEEQHSSGGEENITLVPEIEPRRKMTRQNRGIPPVRYDPCNNANTTDIDRDPKHYKEAMNSPHSDKWMKAMEDELDAIERNNTWKVVNLPQGRRAIGCKWVYKTKRDQTGNVKERKARLVAQGFSQKYGIDYDEVFAPVAKGTTMRILLSVAGKRGYFVRHWDVKSAFLNGNLQEEIYMKQPPGFELGSKVLKLEKSLYGLKQAAHVWNQQLHKVLVEAGFSQSKADNCLYTKHKDGKAVYLLIHVDDIIATSDSKEALESTRIKIGRHFELKDLGGAKQYLGIDIERIDGEIFISQKTYINSIVEEAGLENAKESKFPLDTGYFKAEETATQEQLKLLESNSEYRKLIGMMLYLVINTRPDVAASIAILSKRVEHPRVLDLCELRRVIRYVKGTRDLKLRLNDKHNKEEKLIAFADANWAEDRSDRKSTSGHYCSLNGGTISWFSRKQHVIALSSCEAEYVALAETCKEVTWIREVTKEFDIKTMEATTVYTDNQSCIAMVINKKHSNKTKHVDVKYHYVRDEAERGRITLRYVPSEHNVADLMTKPLAGIKIEALRKCAGLEHVYRKQERDHHEGRLNRNNKTGSEHYLN